MKAFEKLSTQTKIIYLFIFCLAGLFFAGTIVSFVNDLLGKQLMESAWGLRISSAIQMLLMFFMPAVTLITWSNEQYYAYLKINKLDNGIIKILFSFIILIAAMPFISLLTQLNQLLVLPDWLSGLEVWMKELELSGEKTTKLLLSGESLVVYLSNLFFIGVVAAIAEEVFFRGVLQQLLIKQFNNKHVGVWLAAIIFSVMHMQFYGFLPRLILGALLGYLFVWSKSLWIPIFIHFINNALVITFNFFFKDSPIYQSLENQSFTFIFIFSGILSLCLSLLLLWLYRAKNYTYKSVDLR